MQVSLPAGGGQGRTSDAAEVGRIALEQPRERNVVLEPVGRSGASPESAECWEPAFESVGAKSAAPEQGSLYRPAKRTRSCSWCPCLESFALFAFQALSCHFCSHVDTGILSLAPLKHMALSVHGAPSEPRSQAPYAKPLAMQV
jgi:hypothetical protein